MSKPNTSRWTVAKYVDEIYLPSRLALRGVSLTASTVDWFHYIIRKLDKFVGHPAKMREVTPELIDKFQKDLAKQGHAKRIPPRMAEVLRAIIRHWRPEVFPINPRRGTPPLMLLNADVPDTLEHVFTHVYLPVRTAITSQATIYHYGRVIRLYGEFLGRLATLADLTDESCGRFLRWMVEGLGVKAVTANGYWKQLRAMWEWCARKQLVSQFPTLEQLPEPEVVPEAWTLDEMKKLIAAAKEARGELSGIPACDYWQAFHYLQWDTGERTGAMLGLTWDMIDWKAGHLLVPGEVRKGGKKAMLYRPKPSTLNLLRRIIKPQRKLIFAAVRWNFYDHYKALVKAAGLPWKPHKCGPQKMRRSFASHLEALGGSATKALRHTSRLVTEQSYLDPRISEVESQNLKLPHLGDL